MIVYALIVTFAFGTLVGCIGLFSLILHLDERDKKKAAAKSDYSRSSQQAVKLVGDNPFNK